MTVFFLTLSNWFKKKKKVTLTCVFKFRIDLHCILVYFCCVYSHVLVACAALADCAAVCLSQGAYAKAASRESCYPG